jgi:hypothetical protein
MARRALVSSKTRLVREREYAALPVQAKRDLASSIAESDPDVLTLQNEADMAKASFESLDLEYKERVRSGELPDQTAPIREQLVAAKVQMEKSQRAAALVKNSLTSRFLTDSDPIGTSQKMYEARLKQEQELLKKEEAAAVAAAGAGGKDDNKVDPIVLSEMDKALEVRERAKSEKKATVGQRDMERWSKAKNRVIEVVGGPEKIAEIVDQATSSFTGANLLGDKNAIKVRIREIVKSKLNPTSNAFYQEAPRGGLQSVDWEEVIDETVEEVFKARENARARAAAPVPPTPKSYKAPGTFQSE